MSQMSHTATYVCVTDERRSKTFPFADGMTPPREIQDAGTGDVFTLRAVVYEAPLDVINAAQARLRDWNARLFGGQAA